MQSRLKTKVQGPEVLSIRCRLNLVVSIETLSFVAGVPPWSRYAQPHLGPASLCHHCTIDQSCTLWNETYALQSVNVPIPNSSCVRLRLRVRSHTEHVRCRMEAERTKYRCLRGSIWRAVWLERWTSSYTKPSSSFLLCYQPHVSHVQTGSSANIFLSGRVKV